MRSLAAAVVLFAVVPSSATADACRHELPAEVVDQVADAIERRLWPTVPQRVAGRVADQGFTLYQWWHGYGDLRVDLHWVAVAGMPHDRAPQLLHDMNASYPWVFGRESEFLTYVGWPPARDGEARRLGELVPLDIVGPDDGWVAYTEIERSHVAATTAQGGALSRINPWDEGSHPVSGSREWGYFRAEDGTLYFYTMGVESASMAAGGAISDFLGLQSDTWDAWARDVGRVVVRRLGGRLAEPGVRSTASYLESFWMNQDEVELTPERPPHGERIVRQILGWLDVCAQRQADCRRPSTGEPAAWCAYGICMKEDRESGRVSPSELKALERSVPKGMLDAFYQGLHVGHCRSGL